MPILPSPVGMTRQRNQQRIVRATVVLGGVVFLVGGVWAFGWPRHFYDTVAQYPPFNLHLFHDLGAFQLGLAAAMLGALVWQDALFVGLLGGSTGMVVHAISHVVDRNLGGNPSDPYLLSALALVVVAGTVLRWRSVTRETGAGGIGMDLPRAVAVKEARHDNRDRL
jgi:hypothetical protein